MVKRQQNKHILATDVNVLANTADMQLVRVSLGNYTNLVIREFYEKKTLATLLAFVLLVNSLHQIRHVQP